MADERIRTELEFAGTESIDRAIVKEHDLKAAVYEVSEAYGANANAVQAASDKKVAATVRVTEAQKLEAIQLQNLRKMLDEEATAGAAAVGAAAAAGWRRCCCRRWRWHARYGHEPARIRNQRLRQHVRRFRPEVDRHRQQPANGGAVDGPGRGLVHRHHGRDIRPAGLRQQLRQTLGHDQGLPDPAKLKEAAEKLQEQANKYKASVEAAAAKPAPGTEGGQAAAKATVESVFAGPDVKKIEKQVMSALLGGGAGGDYTAAEVAELGGAEAERTRLMGMQQTERDIIKSGRTEPGYMPTNYQPAIVAAAAKAQEIKQRVATRTADRLMDEAMRPGKAGKEARRRLANLAKQSPDLFPQGFASRLADIDTADDRVAREATEKFALQTIEEEMEEELGFHGPPPPMRGFMKGVREPWQQWGEGVKPPGYGEPRPAQPIAERRKQALEREQAISRQNQPNVMGPRGNMVFDPRFDEFGNILEQTQRQMGQTHQYMSRDSARLHRLRSGMRASGWQPAQPRHAEPDCPEQRRPVIHGQRRLSHHCRDPGQPDDVQRRHRPCTPYSRGGIPELHFSRIVGKLAALPDAWSAKSCQWSNGASYPGTTYFSGWVADYSDHYDRELGWIRAYRALGLHDLGDKVPVTDSNTLSDTATFNLPADDIYAIPSRQGRTMGQCVLDLLSMPQIVTALAAYGIGNFTSAGSGRPDRPS